VTLQLTLDGVRTGAEENLMAASDTQATIAGNLVEDPELRFTPIPREFAISEVRVGVKPDGGRPRMRISGGLGLGTRVDLMRVDVSL
jgi:hypothetical protein